MSNYQHIANAEYVDRSPEIRVVDATLALVYEQRTANLIALWSNPQSALEDIRGNPVTYSLNDNVLGKILQEISERLDLS